MEKKANYRVCKGGALRIEVVIDMTNAACELLSHSKRDLPYAYARARFYESVATKFPHSRRLGARGNSSSEIAGQQQPLRAAVSTLVSGYDRSRAAGLKARGGRFVMSIGAAQLLSTVLADAYQMDIANLRSLTIPDLEHNFFLPNGPGYFHFSKMRKNKQKP